MKKLLVQLGVSKVFTIQRGKYRLRIYPSSLSLALWIDPFCRYETERFFQRFLAPGDTVVDVGANIGTLTLEASVIVGATGMVYSIEPHPRLYRYLLGNVALNTATNIIPLNVALGANRGPIGFIEIGDDTQSRIADQDMDERVPVVPNQHERLAVQLIRLDDLPIVGEITLLKIDVEGYEKFVLEGAESNLKKTKCIYFEWGEKNFTSYGYHGTDLLKFLKERGFQVFFIQQHELLNFDPQQSVFCKNIIATRAPEFLNMRYNAVGHSNNTMRVSDAI